ncbi:hypothetical protein HYT01_02850 [Candidatus Giovannonibacteria bacterium]|nr:hypothetical protein [Candidatus Giovannonibacteria bacterium]
MKGMALGIKLERESSVLAVFNIKTETMVKKWLMENPSERPSFLDWKRFELEVIESGCHPEKLPWLRWDRTVKYVMDQRLLNFNVETPDDVYIFLSTYPAECPTLLDWKTIVNEAKKDVQPGTPEGIRWEGLLAWCRNRKFIKPDGYGFPAGDMEKWDAFDEEELRKENKVWDMVWNREKSLWEPFGMAAATLTREYAEETGQTCWSEKNVNGVIHIIPKFSLICAKSSPNRDKNEKNRTPYENYYFHVEESYGPLNTHGVEGETRAPEIIPIMKLNPEFNPFHRPKDSVPFYRKHLMGLSVLLHMKIESGKPEYKEPLNYLQRTFPPVRMPKITAREIFEDVPEEDAWAKATKNVVQFNR